MLGLALSSKQFKMTLCSSRGLKPQHVCFRNCFDQGLMTPVHELLHTLGFVHEHTRPDRDNFVAGNTDNIKPGKEGHLEKRKQGYSDFFEKGSV